MNWTLTFTLGGLALLITLLMRPEIFLTMLRGGGEKAERKVYMPKSEQDFQRVLDAQSDDEEAKR